MLDSLDMSLDTSRVIKRGLPRIRLIEGGLDTETDTDVDAETSCAQSPNYNYTYDSYRYVRCHKSKRAAAFQSHRTPSFSALSLFSSLSLSLFLSP